MRALIERLAAGSAVYETPDVEISENSINVELETDRSFAGTIVIKGKNNMKVKGVVFSSDDHITFENNQFFGIENKINYTVSSKNMSGGDLCNGVISVVSTAGDYEIPFSLTVKKREIRSAIGNIADLSDFVKLVQESYDEALIMFLSKDFKNYFLGDDLYGANLYVQVMRNPDRHLALEEFLVGMDLKERVAITIPGDRHEYMDISENYGDVLCICRSTWGYVDIDIEIKGEFLYNCKDKITGSDFNGKIAEYQYLINSSKLHGGINRGSIILRTSEETLLYDIVIINQKNNVESYINKKNSDIDLVRNYLQFRTESINSKKWMEKMGAIADKRLANDVNDPVGLLSKAQIAILRKDAKAGVYLTMAYQSLKDKKQEKVEEYCYYLYLKTLFRNDPEVTEDVKSEIKGYYDSGHDTWKILWILFYMDDSNNALVVLTNFLPAERE